MEYITEKKYEKLNFKIRPLIKGEFEACYFSDCDFSEAELSEVIYTDCEFVRCNLSMAKLYRTSFRDVKFNDCKMLGLHFEECNEFGLFSGLIIVISMILPSTKQKLSIPYLKIHNYKLLILLNAI